MRIRDWSSDVCSSDLLADWGSLPAGFEAVAFNDNLVEQAALAARLADFHVLCAMRERTPFPAALFARLPKLHLFVTSGMRNTPSSEEHTSELQSLMTKSYALSS